MRQDEDEIEIDLQKLLLALWKKAWLILLSTILGGALFLAYTVFLITPLYKASAMLYVNNSSFSVGNTSFSISNSDLVAAQSLVDTYVVILKTRPTLERVIADTGVDYDYEELYEMIEAAPVNSTEIFEIEVTSPDPQEAELIANSIATILPDRISDIVDGSSVRIVQHAVVPAHKDSPSLAKNTAIGLVLGFMASCGVIVLLELLDSQIHDQETLIELYQLPVMAVIPDLLESQKVGNGYGYGSSSKRTATNDLKEKR